MKPRSRRNLVTLAMLAAIALGAVAPAAIADEPVKSWQRFDERGRFSGTVRQVGEGRVRFYDEKGRFAGSAYRERSGAWQTYDRRGAFKGTAREVK